MPSDNIYYEKELPHPLQQLWRKLHSDLPGMIGFYGFIGLIMLCFINQWIVPHPINGTLTEYKLLPPAWSPNGDLSFILGTDQFGQDIFSCLIMGVTDTFGSALLVSLIVSLLGTLMGFLAVISRRSVAMIIIHIFDFLIAIPSILLAIIFAMLIGPSLQNIMLAIGLSILPRFIHAIYQAVNNEINKEYIVAVRLDGASIGNILFYSILPNIMTIWITEFVSVFTIAIIDITTFGFFGLTNELFTTEWGVMMKQASRVMDLTPWPLIYPGLAITLTIILVNLLGNGLNKALEIGEE